MVERTVTGALRRWADLGADLSSIELLMVVGRDNLHHFTFCPSNQVRSAAGHPVPASAVDLHPDCDNSQDNLNGEGCRRTDDEAIFALVALTQSHDHLAAFEDQRAEVEALVHRAPPEQTLSALSALNDHLEQACRALSWESALRSGHDPRITALFSGALERLAAARKVLDSLVTRAKLAEHLVERAFSRLAPLRSEGLTGLLINPTLTDRQALERPCLVLLTETDGALPDGDLTALIATTFGYGEHHFVLPTVVAVTSLLASRVAAAAPVLLSDSPEVLETAAALWRSSWGSLEDHLVAARALA